ncbi:MAG: hypothetical protein KQH63_18155 [Desulfobulbaceae bacterium]|nr:hypothetical protein [Desulfobulbaceae bacterium]
MKFIIFFLSVWLLCVNCHAEEITEAFGYTLGEVLVEKDIVTFRSPMGPHDIIPKKKARTVRKVQAYTTPENSRIFMINGINNFPTMDGCLRMVSAISYFLGKKFADVIDEQVQSGNGKDEKGILYTDMDGGKAVSVTCTDESDQSILSIRYTDIKLTKKAYEKWRELHPESELSFDGNVDVEL